MAGRKDIEPARPVGMDIVFMYRCPHCGNEQPVPSPVSPAMIPCMICQNYYPIIPVEESTLYFIRLMLQDGKAAIDPDFN